MGTKTANAYVAASRGVMRAVSTRRRLDGLAARRGVGRAATPRSAGRRGWADRAAVDAFAHAFAEIELDPGFDDFDGLDGQVDILFVQSRREATATRFIDDRDVG